MEESRARRLSLVAAAHRPTITFETGPNVLKAEDEGQVRANLRRSLDFCRQHLACAETR